MLMASSHSHKHFLKKNSCDFPALFLLKIQILNKIFGVACKYMFYMHCEEKKDRQDTLTNCK